MRIGVLSDTHLAHSAPVEELARIAREHLLGIATILHAGDLVSLARVEAALPGLELIAVSGNMDDPATCASLPAKRTVELGGFRIGLVHGWGDADGVPSRVLAEFDGVDCIVFGHTHRPLVERRGGILLFNPGSPTDRRFAPVRSLGVLELGRTITGRLITLGG